MTQTTTGRRGLLKGAAVAAGAMSVPMIATEHMACQRHLPRVRPRLREEGQRHDRWRPED